MKKQPKYDHYSQTEFPDQEPVGDIPLNRTTFEVYSRHARLIAWYEKVLPYCLWGGIALGVVAFSRTNFGLFLLVGTVAGLSISIAAMFAGNRIIHPPEDYDMDAFYELQFSKKYVRKTSVKTAVVLVVIFLVNVLLR